MNKIASILRLDFLPSSVDVGLLAVRLWFGLSLLILHGWVKVSSFHKMAGGFPDPLKIGRHDSLMLSTIAETLCPILIVLGLFARLGALGLMINLGVAFFMVHKMRMAPGPGSGELAYLYLGAFFTVFLAGPGRFSIDGRGSGKGRSAAKKPRPPKE